jgi:glycosyl transferase, family 25
MEIYVINLDERADRWTSVSGQLEGMGLNPTRISAIKGANVNAEILQRYGMRKGRQKITPNEMGCSLSHRLAWQKLAEGSDEWALVLEDDIEISNHLPRFLDQWPARGPRFDIVRIETRFEEVWMAKSRLRVAEVDICPAYSNMWGAAAYLVRRRAARKMLARKWMLRAPVDNAMFDHRVGSAMLLWVGQAAPGLAKCKLEEAAAGETAVPSFSSDLEGERRERIDVGEAQRKKEVEVAGKNGPDGRPQPQKPNRGPLIEHRIRDFVWANILGARPTTTTFKG